MPPAKHREAPQGHRQHLIQRQIQPQADVARRFQIHAPCEHIGVAVIDDGGSLCRGVDALQLGLRLAQQRHRQPLLPDDGDVLGKIGNGRAGGKIIAQDVHRDGQHPIGHALSQLKQLLQRRAVELADQIGQRRVHRRRDQKQHRLLPAEHAEIHAPALAHHVRQLLTEQIADGGAQGADHAGRRSAGQVAEALPVDAGGVAGLLDLQHPEIRVQTGGNIARPVLDLQPLEPVHHIGEAPPARAGAQQLVVDQGAEQAGGHFIPVGVSLGVVFPGIGQHQSPCQKLHILRRAHIAQGVVAHGTAGEPGKIQHLHPVAPLLQHMPVLVHDARLGDRDDQAALPAVEQARLGNGHGLAAAAAADDDLVVVQAGLGAVAGVDAVLRHDDLIRHNCLLPASVQNPKCRLPSRIPPPPGR